MQTLRDQDLQRKAIWRPSIQFYLVLMNLILLCLLFPAVSILFLHQDAKFRDVQLERTINQMRKALENRSSALVRNMALSSGYAVAGYDFTFLNNLVRQVVIEVEEIEYCLIMDANSTAVAHSDPEKVGSLLNSSKDRQAALMLADIFPLLVTDGDYPQVHFIDEDVSPQADQSHVLEALAPIYNGAKLFAVLRCGYSLKGLAREIQAATQDWADRSRQLKVYLASITGIFFTIGVVIAALFTRAFVRSMQVVSNGVSRVAQGDLGHEIQPNGLVFAELLHFSEAFNDMTGQLKRSRQRLDEYNKALERKVAASTKELKDAHDNLLAQAHEAGMAEMAVGILHNIGNAVTPAKVGLYQLFSRVGKKPLLLNLPAALDEIQITIFGQPDVSDRQKRRLMDIIKLVPEAIEEEYALYSREIGQIQDKLIHIEKIIGLQMRYAHLFGDIESVDVPQVAEDALTLLEDDLQNRSVLIVKDFEKVPLVKIEKTKLLQIVVNLIKNGYEAMDEVDIPQRTLFLSIHHEQGPPGYLSLSVKDQGIGFSSGEQKKIFNFGHSTKTKGSGFGLHSCANYLIARNGSISAHSEGRGKGAQFVVRLALNDRNAFSEGG